MWNNRKYSSICIIGLLFATVTCFSVHDKWIIVTTIQYPTPQLKKLAAIPDWHLLVVGDKKTPVDWHLDSCDYLSPEEQEALPYKIVPLLPWNHYSRKNIGYLYAIEHGATIIYDTDDDNEPINGLHPLNEQESLPILTSHDLCVNVYAYFDRPDIWPRGYPLESIKNSTYFQIQSPSTVNIGIEQGIVNEDPDVDAIYRLTHNYPTGIFFPRKPSCALRNDLFCPFNSQNTFFHKKAFFTLYIPSTVSMRVADIWRGYYAQRLLREFDLSIAFSGPSASQKRNDHNLMHDFLLEEGLYYKAAKLIHFLKNWPHPITKDPHTIMHLLFSDLVQRDFLQKSELALCAAWCEDLQKIL
ncbi:MAG: STELLO glycosyltransferase family protein [Candidatus Babeliales bacterium]